MFKTICFGTVFIFIRGKLWPVVCYITNWDAVECEMGVGEVNHSDCLLIREFIQFIKIAVVVDFDQILFATDLEKILRNKLPGLCGDQIR